MGKYISHSAGIVGGVVYYSTEVTLFHLLWLVFERSLNSGCGSWTHSTKTSAFLCVRSCVHTYACVSCRTPTQMSFRSSLIWLPLKRCLIFYENRNFFTVFTEATVGRVFRSKSVFRNLFKPAARPNMSKNMTVRHKISTKTGHEAVHGHKYLPRADTAVWKQNVTYVK
jgi:hypothetical protein